MHGRWPCDTGIGLDFAPANANAQRLTGEQSDMTLETENILERRRLRRKLGLWRVVAIAAGVIALGLMAISLSSKQLMLGKPQIARVVIEGVITEDRKQLQLLKRLAKADNVKGVILFVNSPGGTTTGGEALYGAIRDLAKKKPVVAQFGTVAASAAYIAGLGTDYIVARGNSITGSVGVIMQWPELTGLFEKLGIKMHEIKSGKLKAVPSPFQPLDEETRRVTSDMILEGQSWFVGLVKERRKIDPAAVPGLLAGRVYSGRLALQHKLVDRIGGEEEAVKWLVETRKVASGLTIVDWKPKKEVDWPFAGAIAGFFSAIISGTAARLGEDASASTGIGRLGLDGLVSVWHPGKN